MLRRVRLMAIVLGLCLVPIAATAVSLQKSERAHAQAELDRTLTDAAAAETNRLATYFEEAQRLLRVGAREGAFAAMPDGGGAAVAARANADLAYFEQLYPEAIGEACFISSGGAELARVVHGQPAEAGDLSPDESGSAFFRRTFALRPGRVYQAAPYLSPDTHEWVVSNSTPVAGGAALVHFEVTIESFRRQAARTSGRVDVAVVDGRTRAVVFDGAHAQRPGGKLGRPGDRRFAAVVARGVAAGVADAAGLRVAYRQLPRIPGNANDWWVVATARPLPGGLASLELAPLALMAGALLLLVGVLLAQVFLRRLAGRVNALVLASEAAAAGDLSVRAADGGDDEVGRLSCAFDAMVESLAGLVDRIAGVSRSVAAASGQVAGRSDSAGRAIDDIARAVTDVAAGAERQLRVVGDATATADEVVRAVDESVENAARTADAAALARSVAQEGVEAAEQATAAIASVRAASDDVVVAIRQLSAHSDQIGGIVETITGIAGQTNLLALNAAIEAARAGEQGKGFAVVAEEVRKLAEESGRAAAQISDLVAQIQRETERAVCVVDDGGKRTAEGAEIVERTRESFLSIDRAVEDVGARVDEIAAAARRVSEGAARMRDDMNEVVAVAEQSSASTEQVSASSVETSESTREIVAAAQELAQTAEELERLVGQFRLEQ